MVNLAILGLGRAGSFHLQSLREIDNACARTVFDVDELRCTQIAAAHGSRAASTAKEAIEDDEIDAVVVATPTDAHYELVEQALLCGRPVLTEKPLGCDLSQIDQAFTLAQEKALPLFVAFQRRFDRSFASLVQQTHAGAIGELQFVRSVSRDNPVPSIDYLKISGGIFHDCMVHDLDMVVQIVGQLPTHISAFGSSFIPEIAEIDDFDNVAATLKFPSGAVATIDINRNSAFGYDQRLEVFGDGGMLTADNWHQTSVTHASAKGFHRPPVDFSFPTRYREAYKAELTCFIECVLGNREVPISHVDVRTNHLLAVGMERSAREQRVVAYEELNETPSTNG